MKHQSSYQARRIIGQLQSDEELVGALTRLCEANEIEAGEVRLSGALKQIELARFDRDAGDYKEAHRGGPVEIVTLHGSVGVIGNKVVLRLDALVSADSGLGIQLVSGQVRRAVVEACEFVIDAFDDVAVTRGRDSDSGRLIFTELRSKTPTVERPAYAAAPANGAAAAAPAKETPAASLHAPAAPKQSSLSWNDVSAASSEAAKPGNKRFEEQVSASTPAASATPKTHVPAATSSASSASTSGPAQTSSSSRPQHQPRPAPSHSILESDDDDDDYDDDMPEMKPGDILDHPKLGRCRIMKVEEEDYAHIRLPRGKISKLVLDIFDIKYMGVEDGRNVFSLRMRK